MTPINPIELEKSLKGFSQWYEPYTSHPLRKQVMDVLEAAKERLQQLKGGDVPMLDASNPLTSPEPVIATGRGALPRQISAQQLPPCDHDECPPIHCLHAKVEVIETPRTKAATYAFYDDVAGNMTDVVDPEDMEKLERSLITAEKERDRWKGGCIVNAADAADAHRNADNLRLDNLKLRTDVEKLKSQLTAAEKARDDYATEIYRLAEELQQKKEQ